MAKKIALLVRDRQDEALRMAVGIVLMDDIINVFVLDRKVQESESNTLNLETMKDFDIETYSNCPDNADMQQISNTELAAKLLEYDHIITY